jgi:hypothetical protein
MKAGAKGDSTWGSKTGVKDSQNEFRKPASHKDVPTKKMAGGSKAASTAPKWSGGVAGDPQKASTSKGVLSDPPYAVAEHRLAIGRSKQAFQRQEQAYIGE